MKFRIEVLWEPRDVWIGLYWKYKEFYLCIIPMLPIHVWWCQ